MAGDRRSGVHLFGEEGPEVQAQVIAQEARLYSAGVVHAQRPDSFDASRLEGAGTALSDMVAPQVPLDDVGLYAVDAEDAAALAGSGDLGALVRGEGAKVPDESVSSDGGVTVGLVEVGVHQLDELDREPSFQGVVEDGQDLGRVPALEQCVQLYALEQVLGRVDAVEDLADAEMQPPRAARALSPRPRPPPSKR